MMSSTPAFESAASVAFAVEDIEAVVAGLRARGAELVGELERYEDSYRLCYIRGPKGIIIKPQSRSRQRVTRAREVGSRT